MKTIRYWFGENDFDFNISNSELRTRIKMWLSDYDKKSLIEFVVDNISDDDLFDYFAEDLEEYYEDEARELYEQRR